MISYLYLSAARGLKRGLQQADFQAEVFPGKEFWLNVAADTLLGLRLG